MWTKIYYILLVSLLLSSDRFLVTLLRSHRVPLWRIICDVIVNSFLCDSHLETQLWSNDKVDIYFVANPQMPLKKMKLSGVSSQSSVHGNFKVDYPNIGYVRITMWFHWYIIWWFVRMQSSWWFFSDSPWVTMMTTWEYKMILL